MVVESEGWVWLAMWKDWWQPYSSLRFAMRCYATSMQHRKLAVADVIQRDLSLTTEGST